MRILLLSVLACLTLDLATARPRNQSPADIPRDGITSAIPPGWTLQPADPDRPGKRLMSPDRQGRLVVTQVPARSRSDMDALASMDGERVTYLKRGRSWIVVSGYRGDRIFYRKAMLACSNSRWHRIEFDYPASQKPEYDRFVTRASHALGAHRNEGCGPSQANR